MTLIEMLVVIAILGLLAAVVVPNVLQHFENAKLERARADLAAIKGAVKSYYIREQVVPTLQNLVDPPPELEGFEEVPLDPWGNEYELDTGGAPHEWQVVSFGPDGLPETEDDLTSRRRRR